MERLRIRDIRAQVAREGRFKRAFDQLNLLESKMSLLNALVKKKRHIFIEKLVKEDQFVEEI